MTAPRTPLGGIARQPRFFGAALIVLAVIPAAVITFAVISDLFYGSRHLGSDPVKRAEHLFGSWTLRLLIATLVITPLRAITGWNWLAKHRRTVGLYTFAYACLHLLTWTLLDVQLFISEFTGWNEIKVDILDRPYITIGMLALLLMVPLALTSTKKSIARLGKAWRPLHRLVYVSAVLGIIHYFLAVKRDITGPLIYGMIVLVLLAWRARESWRRKQRGRLEAEPA